MQLTSNGLCEILLASAFPRGELSRRVFEQQSRNPLRMLKLATKFAPQQPAFEIAYAAGFRNAEFWLGQRLLPGWQDIAKLAHDYPMEYVLHFPNTGKLTDSDLQAIVDLYHSLHCRAMVIHHPMLAHYGSALSAISSELVLAVENHGLDPAGFADWAESNTYLTFDVEHLWMLTHPELSLAELIATADRFLERYITKLKHVHMPGYLPHWGEHRPMYCARDFVLAMFDLFAKYKFDGLIVSEVDAEFQNAYDLRMDALLFDGWRNSRKPSEPTN